MLYRPNVWGQTVNIPCVSTHMNTFLDHVWCQFYPLRKNIVGRENVNMINICSHIQLLQTLNYREYLKSTLSKQTFSFYENIFSLFIVEKMLTRSSTLLTRNLDIVNLKLDFVNSKLDIVNWKFDIVNWKLDILTWNCQFEFRKI